jgi:hypothetical protein
MCLKGVKKNQEKHQFSQSYTQYPIPQYPKYATVAGKEMLTNPQINH